MKTFVVHHVVIHKALVDRIICKRRTEFSDWGVFAKQFKNNTKSLQFGRQM